MNGQVKLLMSTILLCLSTLCYAEVSDESLNKILDLSGLTKQVNQLPGVIKSGMEQAKQQGTPMPDAEYDLLVMSADQSILPTEILADIRSSLKETISEEEAKHLLVWYESDLGKEITNAEESAATPEAYQQMMQSAESLLENTELIEYAVRLDTLLGATDMALDLQEHTGIAVYSAIMTAMQPDTPLDIESFKARMDAESAQTHEAVEQMVIISMAYTYQKIEMDKLIKYEAFLNEPTTKKFSKAVEGSLNQAIKTSISKWADTLALLFKSKKEES